LMINLDMVGRLRDERLYVELLGGRGLSTIVGTAIRGSGLRMEETSATRGRSDQATFAAWRVPAVALFTGFHEDYHRITDTPARVNVPGVRRVVDITERLVRLIGDADVPLGKR